MSLTYGVVAQLTVERPWLVVNMLDKLGVSFDQGIVVF